MKGRVEVLALVIPILLVAGTTAYFVVQNMNPPPQPEAIQVSTVSPSSSTTASVAGDVSSNATPPSQTCSSEVDTNSTDGITLSTYLPTNVTMGDVMCLSMTIENDNQSTISSLSGSVMINDSQGQTVYEDTLVPFQAGSVSLLTGQQTTFQYLWNTTYPYEGVTPQPGTFDAKFEVQFYGLQPITYIESDVTIEIRA